MHNDTVIGIDLEPLDVAHHMRREFARKFSAVGIPPKQIGVFPILRDAQNPEIHIGRILHILEILTGSRNEKILSGKRRRRKTGLIRSQNAIGLEIFLYFRFVEQQADVSSVALVPAVRIHVRRCADHLHHKGCSQNVFHIRIFLS